MRSRPFRHPSRPAEGAACLQPCARQAHRLLAAILAEQFSGGGEGGKEEEGAAASPSFFLLHSQNMFSPSSFLSSFPPFSPRPSCADAAFLSGLGLRRRRRCRKHSADPSPIHTSHLGRNVMQLTKYLVQIVSAKATLLRLLRQCHFLPPRDVFPQACPTNAESMARKPFAIVLRDHS